jgi:hypothetical protein
LPLSQNLGAAKYACPFHRDSLPEVLIVNNAPEVKGLIRSSILIPKDGNSLAHGGSTVRIMKSLLLVGGSLGSGVGMSFSCVQGYSWPSCFWHGCAWRKSLEQSEDAGQSILLTTTTQKVSRA